MLRLENFIGLFVLVSGDKIEISFDNQRKKLYLCTTNMPTYFNVIKEAENNYYAVFEDDDVKDTWIDFEYLHTGEEYENNKNDLKFETINKKIIIANKCDDCGDLILWNGDFEYCNECGKVACKECAAGWSECQICDSMVCNDCPMEYDSLTEQYHCSAHYSNIQVDSY